VTCRKPVRSFRLPRPRVDQAPVPRDASTHRISAVRPSVARYFRIRQTAVALSCPGPTPVCCTLAIALEDQVAILTVLVPREGHTDGADPWANTGHPPSPSSVTAQPRLADLRYEPSVHAWQVFAGASSVGCPLGISRVGPLDVLSLPQQLTPRHF